MKHTALWIPDEIQGMESSGKTIYGAGKAGTPTAIGQVFRAPKGHRYLRKVGFLVMHPTYDRRPSTMPGVTVKVNIRLIVSEWNGERAEAPARWQSESVSLPKQPSELPRIDWLWFDVPALELDSAKTYIAWLTMAELSAAGYDSISIVRMGPRSRTAGPPADWPSLYPDGVMAIWNGANPDHSLTSMTRSLWNVEMSNVNLHFRMLFQSFAWK